MTSSTLHNTVIGTLAVVLIALGYFLFVQPDSFNLSDEATSPLDDQILARTQEFISRREQLSGVTLDQSVFSDGRFTTLRSYTPTLEEQTLGKASIFDRPDSLKEAATQKASE